jgi:hypothetical protein
MIIVMLALGRDKLTVRSLLCYHGLDVTKDGHKDGDQNGGQCLHFCVSPKEKPPPAVKADEGSHRRSKPLLVRVKLSFWETLHELGV